jgi:hypothetical protein
MMAAIHLDNWLFILLIAVAMLFRWLASVASKASKGSDETDESSTSTPPTAGPTRSASPARTVPRAPVESDEERIRKFLEALGQPAGSRPPPPVSRKPTYEKPIVLPHVGPFGSPLPPLTTRPPDLPEETTQSEPVVRPLHRKKTFKPRVSETTFDVRQRMTPSEPAAPTIKSPAEAYAIATEPRTEPARSETNIAALLRSPSGLRSAIILREVFGPPRSLQPLELL